jgi:hypothetical protein
MEQNYELFFQIEPDVTVIRDGWVPALVKATSSMDCENGIWQIGSPSFDEPDRGSMRSRLDFHLNGNAMYILGCPAFEDYKCRMQTFYKPYAECAENAGCFTGQAHEAGYDHAMYRFRMHPANFEYSRTILHRFAVHPVIRNLGEAVYEVEQFAQENKLTYFVHSKTAMTNNLAHTLKNIFTTVRLDISAPEYQSIVERLTKGLRTGSMDKNSAVFQLCIYLKNALGKMEDACKSILNQI